MPNALFDEEMGPSYDVKKTAFQEALKTDKSRWEWLEESPSNGEQRPKTRMSNYPGIPGYEHTSRDDSPFEQHRPELPLFSMAMVGGGRVTTRAHLHGESQPLSIKWYRPLTISSRLSVARIGVCDNCRRRRWCRWVPGP